MSITEIEALVAIVIAVTAAGIGLYKYVNARVSRIYGRFDEYKERIEARFVYREMCQVLHQNNTDNFIKLEKRVDDGFKSVEQKIGDLQKLVLNKGAER
jgi:hypothetical protein